MARTRAAVDTIRGYYYQFDYYILKILDADDNQQITLEGIEDVDIVDEDDTTAIQCKYYSGQEYNHSVIAKAIRFMFKDYIGRVNENEQPIKYKLYGNFKSGQNKLPTSLSVEFVKENFFSFTQKKNAHRLHEELHATDVQIDGFIKSITININGKSFEDQEKLIISRIKEQFNCTEIDAELYYFNNALRSVRRIAVNRDIEQRKITKALFLSEINNKKMLFDRWYLEFKGIESMCRQIRRQYFTKTNVSPAERFFLIECDSSINDSEIVELLQKIVKNWSKTSKREKTPFCPYVFLHNIDDSRLIGIKKLLVNCGLRLRDGYEFLGADFSAESIIARPFNESGVKIKIINKMEEISRVLSLQNTLKEIYQFYLQEPFFTIDSWAVTNIQIPSTIDINKMV